MATRKKTTKTDWMNDGDDAHWESAADKERAMKAPSNSGLYVQQEKVSKKRITPSDANSSAKYTGKKTVVKKSTKKVVTKR